MALAKSLFLVFTLALCVAALTSPHIARAHHHRAISARLANLEEPQSFQPRKLSKRCKPRPANTTTTTANNNTTSSNPADHQPPPPKAPAAASPSPPPPPKAEPTPTPTPSPPPPPPKPSPSPSPSPTPQNSGSNSGSSGNSGNSGNLPSFLVGTQTGQGTFYSTGLGSCGITNTDADYIAAVSHLLYDAFPGYNRVNPNTNPICGRKVKVTYQGKTVTVAITDRCEGCALTDLDFSPSAFNQLADFSVGRLSGVQWLWI